MPVKSLFLSNGPGSEVPALTAQEQRAFYRNIGDLAPEDKALGICPWHRKIDFKRTNFLSWPLSKELPPDILFGTVREIEKRAAYCSLCHLTMSWINNVASEGTRSSYVEVMGCWIRDGQLRCPHALDSDPHTTTALPHCATENCPRNSTSLRWRLIPKTASLDDFSDLWCDFVPTGGNVDLFCGRPLLPTRLNIPLMREWLANCDAWHQGSCGSTSTGEPHPGRDGAKIRLLDLTDNCLIETPDPPPYLCLSYVWGAAEVYKTLDANLMTIKTPGSLKTLSEAFPRSIRDAIAVTRLLDERYIWIDSLCIIQDSDDDKGEQISRMDQIYLNAKLAIVVAGGDSADSGIDGIEDGSRHLETLTASPSEDVTLMRLLPELRLAAESSVWNTRGWTYQERLLSRRALFFVDQTVYFQCRAAIWGEDYHAEDRDLVACAPMQDISLSHNWEEPVAKTSTAHKLNIFRRPWYPEYARTVGEYSMRNMRFETDRIAGFGAVLNTLGSTAGVDFVQGMPEDMLLEALLWQPREKLVRVAEKNKGTGMALFPSWSWAGWVGAVEHEDLEDVVSMAPIAERWRRTRPFAKMSFVRMTEQGTKVTKERDVRYYRDEMPPGEGPPGHTRLPLGWKSTELPDHGVAYIDETKPVIYHSAPPSASPLCTGPKTTYNGIRMRTRLASFNLIVSDRSGQDDPDGRPYLRFGISLAQPPPEPAREDETLPWNLATTISGKRHPWLGGIRVPGSWRRRKFRAAEMAPIANEFIILSKAYGFGRDQVSDRTRLDLQPYEVVNVMLVERVQGQSGPGAMGPDSEPKPLLVERLGVGRMLMEAWRMVPETWEDVIII